MQVKYLSMLILSINKISFLLLLPNIYKESILIVVCVPLRYVTLTQGEGQTGGCLESRYTIELEWCHKNTTQHEHDFCLFIFLKSINLDFMLS